MQNKGSAVFRWTVYIRIFNITRRPPALLVWSVIELGGQMVSRLVIALILCFVSRPVQAAETTTAMREMIIATLEQDKQATPQGRAHLIKAVNAYCKEIQSVYPRNLPVKSNG